MAYTPKQSYTIRLANESDLEVITQLWNDCEEADSGLRPVTIDDVKQDLSYPGFEINRSVRLVADNEGRLVGFGSFWDLEKPAVDPWLDLRIHPDYRDTDVVDQLIQWGEQRIQDCVKEAPDDLRVALFTGTDNKHKQLHKKFEQNAFAEARHYWHMKIDLDQPPQTPVWTEGYQPFHYDTKEEISANLEKIVFAFDDSFSDHFGHIKRPLDQTIKEWQHDIDTDKKRFDPKLWFFVMDGDEIAAECLCMKEEYDDPRNGYVNILGVRQGLFSKRKCAQKSTNWLNR